jgi:hypothetical protein
LQKAKLLDANHAITAPDRGHFSKHFTGVQWRILLRDGITSRDPTSRDIPTPMHPVNTELRFASEQDYVTTTDGRWLGWVNTDKVAGPDRGKHAGSEHADRHRMPAAQNVSDQGQLALSTGLKDGTH